MLQIAILLGTVWALSILISWDLADAVLEEDRRAAHIHLVKYDYVRYHFWVAVFSPVILFIFWMGLVGDHELTY